MTTKKNTSWIHWSTPIEVREGLDRMFPDGVDLDPCWNPGSKVRAKFKCDGTNFHPDPGYLKERLTGDGLLLDWTNELFNSIYVNPPYNAGAMKRWTHKIAGTADHLRNHCFSIVVLTAARPSAQWWRTLVDAEPEVLLLWGPGRLSFENPPPDYEESSSTVESALWYFGSSPIDFREAFAERGTFWSLQT